MPGQLLQSGLQQPGEDCRGRGGSPQKSSQVAITQGAAFRIRPARRLRYRRVAAADLVLVWRQNAAADRVAHDLGLIAQVQFAHHVGAMGLHRA